jgi:hypothetical protein
MAVRSWSGEEVSEVGRVRYILHTYLIYRKEQDEAQPEILHRTHPNACL